MPTAFDRALARGKAENPGRRPADVETWLESIEEALAEPAAARAPEPAEQASASTSTARRRPRLVLAAVLVVVGLAAGLGLGEQIWHDPPVAVADGSSLAISGPEKVSVGETSTFTANVEGVESWVWELPDGRFLADESTVSMTASRAGSAEVVLHSRAADGTALEAHHRFRVDG